MKLNKWAVGVSLINFAACSNEGLNKLDGQSSSITHSNSENKTTDDTSFNFLMLPSYAGLIPISHTDKEVNVGIWDETKIGIWKKSAEYPAAKWVKESIAAWNSKIPEPIKKINFIDCNNEPSPILSQVLTYNQYGQQVKVDVPQSGCTHPYDLVVNIRTKYGRSIAIGAKMEFYVTTGTAGPVAARGTSPCGRNV